MARPVRWVWTLSGVFIIGLFCLVILNGCGTSRAAGIQADGRLAPCPSSPNCVCSQDPDSAHQIAAITYTGERSDAHRRLLAAIATIPRSEIVNDSTVNQGTYLHATATTLIMRYTDDLEFIIDDANKRIEVRSLSRIGYSDLGVNRRRVEALREAFGKAQ